MVRPRFTLRVVLVVTTIAAIALAQYPLVLRRKHALKEIDNYMVDSGFSNELLKPLGVNPIRRLCGDVPVRVIYLPPSTAAERIAEIGRLFPEAYIRVAALRELDGRVLEKRPLGRSRIAFKATPIFFSLFLLRATRRTNPSASGCQLSAASLQPDSRVHSPRRVL